MENDLALWIEWGWAYTSGAEAQGGQFSCYTKLIKTKNVLLNWYYPTKFFLEKFGWFLTLKIHFESPNVGLFDKLSPDGDSKSGNFIWLQLILGQKPCLCRVHNHEIPLPKLI